MKDFAIALLTGVALTGCILVYLEQLPLLTSSVGNLRLVSLTDPVVIWLMEDLVGTASVHMGLPGLAAIAVFVNPLLETVPKILRDKDTRKMPLLPFSAMAAQSMVWGTYGILTAAPSVMCPNIFGVVLGLFYCYIFARFCPKGADWLPSTLSAHTAVVLVTFLTCVVGILCVPARIAAPAMGLAGNAGNIIMGAGPLASIQTVLAERDTQSLAFGFTCCLAVNSLLWVIYGMGMVGDALIWVPNAVGLVMSGLQLSLFARFGFGPRKDPNA